MSGCNVCVCDCEDTVSGSMCLCVCDFMGMCCTRVPWIMASKHYYRHASLSGICSIEILGDHFNLADEGAAVLRVQMAVHWTLNTFILSARNCYIKVCLEIETECFIHNVCCHVTALPHIGLTEATCLLLFGKG